MSAPSAAKVVGGLTSITKKYTLQSSGIWEAFRRLVALDPERSNGIPLNPQFRVPAPGSNDPAAYTDPVTLPAGDIADNPYWKRDHRRAYPALSVVGQAEVSGLLSIGSAAAPKVELIGEAGEKAIVAATKGNETGLAAILEKSKDAAVKDLFVGGLPPTPSGQSLDSGKWDVHKYRIVERSYPEGYPCRSFQ